MRKSTQAARAPSVGQQPVESTIGIDLGDRWSRYCVLDGAGAIIEEDRVRTTVCFRSGCVVSLLCPASLGRCQSSVDVIEGKGFWIKMVVQPLQHFLMLVVVRVADGTQ